MRHGSRLAQAAALSPAIILSVALLLAANVDAFSRASSANSMERKLQHIQQNGALAHPDPAPTEFTEAEINDYFASGNIKLPAGVQSVRLQGQPDIVTGTARVDFDQLKAGQRSSNPLLSVFSGVHDVVVVAHARGIDHQGYVQVDSVSLDGVQIPRFALELFAQKYLTPKYPNVGVNSRFALPNKIATANVGAHKLTVTQK
jgi:hypothetical protein